MAHQLDQCPRRRARRGVVAREHHRDEDPGYVVGAHLDGDEHVEQVAVPAGDLAAPLALVDDPLDQPDQLLAGGVADAERLDVGVRVDVRNRVGAALELVVVLGERRVQLLTERFADQAGGGRVDRQLGEPVEQVDLPLVAPGGDHPPDLVLDGLRVAAHHVAAQRLVLQHLLALLGRGVEHHPLAEDRRHERVRRRLVERRVRRPEELLVGPGSGDQHYVAVAQPEPADLAALRTQPFEQADRVDPHLREVAVPVVRYGVGDLAHVRGGPGGGHRSSTGASGLTSTRLKWVPRGALTTIAMASAIALGLRKWPWRAWPHLTHSLSTKAPASGSQSLPISLQVEPGRTTLPRTPPPSSSIWIEETSPSSPHLLAV